MNQKKQKVKMKQGKKENKEIKDNSNENIKDDGDKKDGNENEKEMTNKKIENVVEKKKNKKKKQFYIKIATKRNFIPNRASLKFTRSEKKRSKF